MKGFEFDVALDAAHVAVTATVAYTAGFDRRGTGDLAIVVPFDITTLASGSFTVVVQHADTQADGTAPDPGDFANATDLDGTAIGDSIAQSSGKNFSFIRITGDSQLKEWVRVGLARVGGTNTTAEVVYLALNPVRASKSSKDDAVVAR